MATIIGRIQVRPLTLADASREVAGAVMTVHLDAYSDRFGDQFRDRLAESLKADLENAAHVNETLKQLHYGPKDGWYWVAALEEVEDVTVVHGFAVAIVRKRQQEIFLAEIHTHPGSQRRGLAKAMLKELLQFVGYGPRGIIVAGWPVTLNVARCFQNDDSEWPFAWYMSIGFKPYGVRDFFPLGGGALPMTHMRGEMGEILPNLVIDRGDAVD